MVMNETELRMIKEMLNKQKELVSETMKEFGLTTIEEEQLSQALLCEVGEFISETKQDWCWWMKNPPAIDESKKLGEFIDIWSLVLTHVIIDRHGLEPGCLSWLNECIDVEKGFFKDCGVTRGLSELASYRSLRLEKIVALSELLGYSIEQIYTENMKKNAINMERLKNGY